MIVDLCRIEAGDGNGRKEGGEEIGAGGGQLVERERAAGNLRQDGEETGAGGRLQHPVVGVTAPAVSAARPSGTGVENC